jgi:hypothetical protein
MAAPDFQPYSLVAQSPALSILCAVSSDPVQMAVQNADSSAALRNENNEVSRFLRCAAE